jgi:hypothetical protein
LTESRYESAFGRRKERKRGSRSSYHEVYKTPGEDCQKAWINLLSAGKDIGFITQSRGEEETWPFRHDLHQYWEGVEETFEKRRK